jgi:hypothetical protein
VIDCQFRTADGTCQHIDAGVGLPIIVDESACTYCIKDRKPQHRAGGYVVQNLIWGERNARGLPVGEIPTLPQPPKTSTAKRELIGDKIKKALSVVGITEERVSKLIGRPCGCSRRAQKLNDIDAGARNTVKAIVNKFRGSTKEGKE